MAEFGSVLSGATLAAAVEILEPHFLRASKAIYDQLEIPFGNTSVRLLGLADGYALLADPQAYPFAELEELVLSFVRHEKTLLIENIDAETVEWLDALCRRITRMEVVEVRGQKASLFRADRKSNARPQLLALYPHGFLRRRAVLQRAQEHMVVQAGQDTLPKQAVCIIGVGPTRAMVTQRAADLIASAPLVVTFDYVNKVIEHLSFQGRVVVLDYDWESFAANVDCIDRQLAILHAEGHYDVTVVIIGNPEVYDLLSFLSLAGRNYSFEPTAPAVTLCCAWITEHYGLDITHPSYVIVSGCNARLGVPSAKLALELNAYLRLELTCLVIELYSGDLPLVLKHVWESARPKIVFILINMFSSGQQVLVLPANSMDELDLSHWTREKFISLAIVDEERVQRNPETSGKLLWDFGRAACGKVGSKPGGTWTRTSNS